MKAKKRKPGKWIVLIVVVLALAAGTLMRPSEGAMYTEAKVERGDIRL